MFELVVLIVLAWLLAMLQAALPLLSPTPPPSTLPLP